MQPVDADPLVTLARKTNRNWYLPTSVEFICSYELIFTNAKQPFPYRRKLTAIATGPKSHSSKTHRPNYMAGGTMEPREIDD